MTGQLVDRSAMNENCVDRMAACYQFDQGLTASVSKAPWPGRVVRVGPHQPERPLDLALTPRQYVSTC